jgi:hypothetical protein
MNGPGDGSTPTTVRGLSDREARNSANPGCNTLHYTTSRPRIFMRGESNTARISAMLAHLLQTIKKIFGYSEKRRVSRTAAFLHRGGAHPAEPARRIAAPPVPERRHVGWSVSWLPLANSLLCLKRSNGLGPRTPRVQAAGLPCGTAKPLLLLSYFAAVWGFVAAQDGP